MTAGFKTRDTKFMRYFGIVDGFLILVFTVSLILLSFFSTIHSDFKDVPSMLSFLKNGRVYDNLSDVARIQIQNSYPDSITKNILLTGIANKIVETVVTPRLVEIAAKPAVTASVQFARSPAEIIDEKVVVPTAQYKTQVNSTLSDFGLPNILTTQLTRLVNSLPTQITLVDLEKHPNSVLAMLIKARALFDQNEVALSVTWTILVITAILIFVLHLHDVKKLIQLMWIGFGISSVVIFTFFFVIPWLLQMNLQHTGSALETAQNTLVMDAVTYFMVQIRVYGIVYLVTFVVSLVIYKFVKFDKFQMKWNRILKKLHIPTISVKSA